MFLKTFLFLFFILITSSAAFAWRTCRCGTGCVESISCLKNYERLKRIEDEIEALKHNISLIINTGKADWETVRRKTMDIIGPCPRNDFSGLPFSSRELLWRAATNRIEDLEKERVRLVTSLEKETRKRAALSPTPTQSLTYGQKSYRRERINRELSRLRKRANVIRDARRGLWRNSTKPFSLSEPRLKKIWERIEELEVERLRVDGSPDRR